MGYAPYEPARSFPEILRTYRRADGLSQERLAKLARIDASTLAKWERGDARPMAATRRRLRRFFEGRGMAVRASAMGEARLPGKLRARS